MALAVILDRKLIHLFKSGQRTLLLEPRGDEPGHAPPHHAGDRIPLVPRFGAPATCTLRVTRVTDIALGEIDDQDARALGYRDVDAWMAAWVEEHGLFNERARAWRAQVEVDPSEPSRVLPAQSGRPFGAAQLLPNALPGRPTLRGAGESPDPQAVAGYNRTAHASDHDRVEQLLTEREQISLSRRIELAEADALARGIRIYHLQRRIANDVKALEQLVYRAADRYASEETPA